MKIFTETDKWMDGWFQELTPIQKLCWFWINEHCNLAGVFRMNLKQASFDVKARITLKTIQPLLGRIVQIGGDLWLVKGYIRFQQNCPVDELDERNGAHKKIKRLIKEFGIAALLSEDPSPLPPKEDRGSAEGRAVDSRVNGGGSGSGSDSGNGSDKGKIREEEMITGIQPSAQMSSRPGCSHRSISSGPVLSGHWR